MSKPAKKPPSLSAGNEREAAEAFFKGYVQGVICGSDEERENPAEHERALKTLRAVLEGHLRKVDARLEKLRTERTERWPSEPEEM